MPPVDYCASCEGQKAESRARAIASDRELPAFDVARTDLKDPPASGAPPPVAGPEAKTRPVGGSAPHLLAPDLAVLASLAQAQSSPTGPGADPTRRLQAFQAYGAAPGARPGA
jgi:hypothetical protein